MARPAPLGRGYSRFQWVTSLSLPSVSFLVSPRGLISLLLSSQYCGRVTAGYYVTVLTIEKLGRKWIQIQGFLMAALFRAYFSMPVAHLI